METKPLYKVENRVEPTTFSLTLSMTRIENMMWSLQADFAILAKQQKEAYACLTTILRMVEGMPEPSPITEEIRDQVMAFVRMQKGEQDDSHL
jgi:hypothetical protein